MPRDLKEILAEAFPAAEISPADKPATFIVRLPEAHLRVMGLQMPEGASNDKGVFARMTARPGVDWP